MVAPPTGDEGKVSIPIGASYDKASVDAAAAQFEAKVQDLITKVNQLMEVGFGGKPLRGWEQAFEIMKAEYADAPNVLIEAYKRLTDAAGGAIKPVEEVTKVIEETDQVAEGMGQKTTAAFEAAGANVEAFNAKVANMKALLMDVAASTGASYENIGKALSPLMGKGDKPAFSEAIKQLINDEQSAATASDEMKNRTVGALQAMGDSVEGFRAKVNQMKEVVLEFAKTTGASYQDIQKALTPQITPQDRPAFGQAIKELTADLKTAGTEKDKFKGNVTGLGGVLTYVFGTVLGLTAISIIRKFIDYIKEAIAMGEEWITTLFRMSVAVRALQRSGLEITLEEVNKQIIELNQAFPQFSKIALTQGVTNAMLFTANLKMSKDQINEMIKASITLAAVMGRDVNEVMRTMALTLSSGYSEGLQRLGININKVVITEKAHAMGIKEGYQAMTQYQRAIAALALITEQTAKMQADAAKYQNTAAGQLAVGTANLTNATVAMGAHVAPFWSKFIYQLGDLALTVSSIFDLIVHTIEFSVRRSVTLLALLVAAVASAAKTLKEKGNLEDYGKNVAELFKTINKQAQGEIDILFQPEKIAALGNVPTMAQQYSAGLTEEEQQNVSDAADSLEEKLTDIVQQGIEDRIKLEEDYASDLAKIDTDLQRDLEKIALDMERDLEDAARDHQRKLISIDQDTARKRADAALQLSRNLADDALKYEQDVADAREKHRQQELDDEADYQRKLKHMQEEFAFDVEEAIGSRDIKTAFRILRRYKLDYSQAQEDYVAQQKERDIAFQREMQQLERQKNRRAEERQREYQQKLEDIARQAAQDRADEAVRYQREILDRRARAEQERLDRIAKAEQERKDRLAQYQQQLIDLDKSLNDQYKKLADSLVKQYKMTSEMVKALYNIYLGVYGPNGAMDKLYKYMVESAARAAYARDKALNSTGQTQTTTTTGSTGSGHAEGGVFVATRPMTATFGEKGPEVVSVTPLSYIGRNTGRLVGGVQSVSGGNGSMNSIKLDILLSRDLEARIIDTALDQMSDIMVSVERERG